MAEPDTGASHKTSKETLSRRVRLAIALLAAWAIVMSVAFAWLWAADQQVEQGQRAIVNRIVYDIGQEYGSASGGTLSMLYNHDVGDGWIAAAWMEAVSYGVEDLSTTPEGNTVVQALHLYLEPGRCAALWYQDVFGRPGFNSSWLNGTNQFTTYFGTVENLTYALGLNFIRIAGNGNNALDQLDSPAASVIRSDTDALYAASPFGPGVVCPA